MEQAFRHAAEWEGPIVVHVLTQKGRGYAPAEEDDIQNLHDFKVPRPAPAARHPVDTEVDEDASGAIAPGSDRFDAPPLTYSDAFTRALLSQAEQHAEIVALTAAMPGPTGLLPFQARFPDRFFDVGIAEQHELTAAAGMAMGGLRPVVAVYSTFFSRAFDQANLDVGLHELPVVFVLDRAGITGDDGPSHHGVLDLVLTLSIPGMTVFAPSSAAEVEVMLEEALNRPGPASIRFSKTPPRPARPGQVGHGLAGRQVRRGSGAVCLLAVGKLLEACEDAAAELAADGIDATVWDVRVVSPPDPEMLADAARHRVVVTAEDGLRHGGAGMFLLDAMRTLVPDATTRSAVLGVPRSYIAQGRPDDILASLGLDGPGIADTVRR